MAKRNTSAKGDVTKSEPVKKTAVASTTPVRKTVTPKKTAAKPAVAMPAPITYERIAERAYFISQSGYGGSQDDNWFRAERELRDGL